MYWACSKDFFDEMEVDLKYYSSDILGDKCRQHEKSFKIDLYSMSGEWEISDNNLRQILCQVKGML